MTPEERTARRAVIKAHHPDRGGDPAMFVELLAAIDRSYGAPGAGPGRLDVGARPAPTATGRPPAPAATAAARSRRPALRHLLTHRAGETAHRRSVMNRSSLGLVAGLLLAIATVAGGLLGLLLAVVLGAVGYAIGGHVDGDFDLAELARGRRRG